MTTNLTVTAIMKLFPNTSLGDIKRTLESKGFRTEISLSSVYRVSTDATMQEIEEITGIKF